MTTLINNTERNIIVFNDHFSREIKGKQSAEIPDEVLSKDSVFYFKFADLLNFKRNVIKKFGGPLRFLKDAKFEIQNIFPIATVLDLKEKTTLYLEEEIVNLRITMIFKPVYLHWVRCSEETITKIFKRNVSSPIECEADHLFLYHTHKTKFFDMMKISNIINYIIMIVISLAVLFVPFDTENYTVSEQVFVVLFSLAIIIGLYSDISYTKKAKKWKVLEDKTKSEENQEDLTNQDSPCS